MNIPHTPLRAPEGDGASGGGTSAPPAQTQQSTQTTPTAPTAPTTPSSQVDVWGQADPPEWTKAIGVDKKHIKVVPPASQTPPAVPAAPVQPPKPPAQPTSPPTAPITADAIAQAIAKVLPQQQTATPQVQPQLSEDQLREQLAIYTANESDYEAAFGVKPQSPAQLAAYNRHLQAIARQAVTVSQVLLQQAISQQQQSVQPYIQAVRSQEAVRQKTLFFHENADLQGYDALVEKEYQQALASGRRFDSVAQARKFIADQTRATLKSIGVTPKSPAARNVTPNQPAASPQTSARQMTTTSVGGRSSGSAVPGKAANSIEAVWGKRN